MMESFIQIVFVSLVNPIIVGGTLVKFQIYENNKLKKELQENNKKLKNEMLKIVEPIIEERDFLKKEYNQLKEAVEKDIAQRNKPIHVEFKTPPTKNNQ